MAARLAWGSLLVLHGAALGRCFAAPESWSGQQISLAAAVLLFALKAADVPLLRVRLSRQSLVACVLVAALLHVDLFRRESVGRRLTGPWALPVLLCLPKIAGPRRLHILRHLWRIISAIGRIPSRSFSQLWLVYRSALVRRPHLLRPGPAAPRSPPLAALLSSSNHAILC